MFLRRPTTDGINIGTCYSILQKCIRRGLLQESLYYGNLVYKDGTPNALRKRLVMYCLEDMCRLDLALEVKDAPDSKLCDYIQLVVRNKKTHLSASLSRIVLYRLENGIPLHSDMKILEKSMTMFIHEDWVQLRKYLGKDVSKLFTFMSKNVLVLVVFELFNSRPELSYPLDRTLETIEPKRFDEVPSWAKDKHVVGGTKGYKFFYENGLVMKNTVYPIDPYKEESLEIYLSDEKTFGNGKTSQVLARLRDDDMVKLLETRFKNVIQIQLLTRRNNPKVYFCTDGEQKKVVKGPLNQDFVERIQIMETLKTHLRVPTLNVSFEKIQNRTWMISNSLVDYTNDFVVKKSKLETERKIYDGPKADLRDITKNFMNLVEAHLIKNLAGTGDVAQRNYLVSNNEVYSVDDMFCDTQHLTSFPKGSKVFKEKWSSQLQIHKKEIDDLFVEWKNRLSDGTDTQIFIDRLEAVKTHLK